MRSSRFTLRALHSLACGPPLLLDGVPQAPSMDIAAGFQLVPSTRATTHGSLPHHHEGCGRIVVGVAFVLDTSRSSLAAARRDEIRPISALPVAHVDLPRDLGDLCTGSSSCLGPKAHHHALERGHSSDIICRATCDSQERNARKLASGLHHRLP